MNYYEHKMLQDRENRGISAGVVFICLSPLGGIVGSFIGYAASGNGTLGFYIGTLLMAATGVVAIMGWVKEKRTRLRNQHA